MKSFYSLIFFLFVGLSISFAQAEGEPLSPEDIEKEPHYYLKNLEDATPNEDGLVKVYLMKYTDKTVEWEEKLIPPGKVYQLYIYPYDMDTKAFPKQVFNFPRLQVLALPMCEFSSIPDNIVEKLPNIQYLDLQSTPVTALPSNINDWKFLEYLNLSATKVPANDVESLEKAKPTLIVFR